VSEDLMIHMRHIRAANLCSRGGRAWFERHGLSWTAFLSAGLPAEVLRQTGDGLALKVVEAAVKERTGG
jgi:hypothetical protein